MFDAYEPSKLDTFGKKSIMEVKHLDNLRHGKMEDGVKENLQPLDEVGFWRTRFLNVADDTDFSCCNNREHDFWPLSEVEPRKARFPCCIVWTPLPIVSWLAPFIGHVGMCREDGAILDFSGSNFVNTDDFAFGAVARYLQLDRQKCCFPPNLSGHTCRHAYRHAENGTAITWDDALRSSMLHFHHKSYNIFTCNCHSFVANCLNRLAYGGSVEWNVVTVWALILSKGRWTNSTAVVKSFLPFVAVLCLGIWMAGSAFLLGLAFFCMLLLGWYLLGTYCIRNLIVCD